MKTGIKKEDLIKYIIRPTLQEMQMWGMSDEILLLITCALESLMGHYLHQTGSGPALGIYQMEPFTFNDIINNYLIYQPDITNRICVTFNIPSIDYLTNEAPRLIHDLKFATVFARLQYYRHEEPLPAADDLLGLARYYKKYYNTSAGKATEQDFMDNYERYVTGEMI